MIRNVGLTEWRGRGDVLVFGYDLVEERPGHPGFGTTTPYDPRPHLARLPYENIVVPLGVVHRRDLLDRAGYFDESFGRHRDREEDTDLWRRFAVAGAAFTFVPEKSGRYHVRADSLSRTRPLSTVGQVGAEGGPCGGAGRGRAARRPDRRAGRVVGRLAVEVREAGRVWDELGPTEVDVLKIDAEGSEVPILESLGPRVSAARAVLVEFHSRQDRRRLDALLGGHDLFGAAITGPDRGVLKYLRSDLVGG
jgi:hypothetical protein